jgi:hypothetical protein
MMMLSPLISLKYRSTDRRSAPEKSSVIGLPRYCFSPVAVITCVVDGAGVGTTGGGGCCGALAACLRAAGTVGRVTASFRATAGSGAAGLSFGVIAAALAIA